MMSVSSFKVRSIPIQDRKTNVQLGRLDPSMLLLVAGCCWMEVEALYARPLGRAHALLLKQVWAPLEQVLVQLMLRRRDDLRSDRRCRSF